MVSQISCAMQVVSSQLAPSPAQAAANVNQWITLAPAAGGQFCSYGSYLAEGSAPRTGIGVHCQSAISCCYLEQCVLQCIAQLLCTLYKLPTQCDFVSQCQWRSLHLPFWMRNMLLARHLQHLLKPLAS